MTDLNEHYRKNVLRILGQNAVIGVKGAALRAASKYVPGSRLERGLAMSTISSVDNVIFGNIRRAAAGKLAIDAETRRLWLNTVRQSRRNALRMGRDTSEHDEILRLLVDL